MNSKLQQLYEEESHSTLLLVYFRWRKLLAGMVRHFDELTDGNGIEGHNVQIALMESRLHMRLA